MWKPLESVPPEQRRIMLDQLDAESEWQDWPASPEETSVFYEAVTAIAFIACGILTVAVVFVLAMAIATAKPSCATVRNPAPGTVKCVPLPRPRPPIKEDKR